MSTGYTSVGNGILKHDFTDQALAFHFEKRLQQQREIIYWQQIFFSKYFQVISNDNNIDLKSNKCKVIDARTLLML
jgi:hypothetical protein